MTRGIRKHARELLALVALVAVAAGVSFYILDHQRMRFPLIEDAPFRIVAEMSTAQAVTPGQGQTVRVSGVRVGDIGKVELRDGRARITMELDRRYEGMVRRDATLFLRPKTGLKDMFIELNPGSKGSPPLREGAALPVSSTLPDVNPDEFLAGLDADTRDYLKLLVNGAGRGLDGRAADLRDVLRRFEPTYRDMAAVSSTVAQRRVELRRLVHSLNRLNGELARKDDDLAQLVSASARVFRSFASERGNVSATVRELPSALREATSALGSVERMSELLGPTSEKLLPVARALDGANEKLEPFQREVAPLLERDIRPFVREARPVVRDLEPGARDLAEAEPALTRSFTVLNHLFNMLGYNPRGAEDPGDSRREEGFLFHLSWLGHQSVNLFSNADAHGPMRALTVGGTCTVVRGTAQSNPGAEFLLGLSGALSDPRVCGAEAAQGATGKKDGR